VPVSEVYVGTRGAWDNLEQWPIKAAPGRFPHLDDAQIAALERCARASRKRYPDGHVFFRVGDRDFFYSREIRADRDSRRVGGRPAIVTAVARGDCEVYEVAPESSVGS
jgi:hypothetical protein